jgi:hypothetical protein
MSIQPNLKRWHLLPALLGISGVVFLVMEAHYVWGVEPTAGVIITAAVGLVGLLFFWLNQRKIISHREGRKWLWSAALAHRSLGLIALVGTLVLTSFNASSLGAIRYSTGPVLTWGSGQDPATSITVMWRTIRPASGAVDYGLDPGNLEMLATQDAAVEWHQVPLTDLVPDTTYYYRVEGLGSTTHSFRTAPAPGDDAAFTFLLFSDPRQNTGRYTLPFLPNMPERMMKTMRAEGITPAFTVCAGDITGDAVNTVTWKSWFTDLTRSGLGAGAAVQVAVGNHERHADPSGEIFGTYYPYTPHPNYYHSFDYGGVHVTVLDPWQETGGWGPLDADQLSWAEQDLAEAAAARYRIVVLHPPPVTGTTPKDDLAPLVTLCEQYGVHAVFFGHDHRFALSTIGATKYCLVGVGGNSADPANGFVQVGVNATAMRVVMRWANGSTQVMGLFTP